MIKSKKKRSPNIQFLQILRYKFKTIWWLNHAWEFVWSSYIVATSVTWLFHLNSNYSVNVGRNKLVAGNVFRVLYHWMYFDCHHQQCIHWKTTDKIALIVVVCRNFLLNFLLKFFILSKTITVTRGIATMQGIEDETERRQTLVNQMRLDASSSDGIKQLKGINILYLIVQIKCKLW